MLLDICARLSLSADVYRAWSGPGTREVHRDIAGEHKSLLDAALAHDADRAVALFEAHLDRTQAILTDFDPTVPTADRSADEVRWSPAGG